MGRWLLLLLPLCLLMQDQRYVREEPPTPLGSDAVAITQKHVLLQGTDLLRQQVLGGMAQATTQPFPGNLPWGPLHEIGTQGLYPLEVLLHYHPLTFLEMCVQRYGREVTGYTLKFNKRERLDGKLKRMEKLEVHFRETPFSVHMHWLETTGQADKALYVKGENNGKLLARGRGILKLSGIWTKDIDSPEAKRDGRFTIDHFGVNQATIRTIAAMHRAQERGKLFLTYHGLYKVPEVGDRLCYKFVRAPYDPPEDEGLNELTLYIDQETWLQVGSVLRDAQGEMIAEYYFRDIKLNPEFHKDQFTRAAL